MRRRKNRRAKRPDKLAHAKRKAEARCGTLAGTRLPHYVVAARGAPAGRKEAVNREADHAVH